MQTINVEVRSRNLFLEHINRCANIMQEIKLIHCYMANDMFKISYPGGIISYDFCLLKDSNLANNWTNSAIELIRNKLKKTRILDSLP